VELFHDYHGEQRFGARVSREWGLRQGEIFRANPGLFACCRDWEGASNWLHNDRPVNSSYIFDYEYGEPDGLRPKEYM